MTTDFCFCKNINCKKRYPKADTEFSIGFPTESMAIKFIKAEIKARKNGKSIVVVNSEQIEKELEGNK